MTHRFGYLRVLASTGLLGTEPPQMPRAYCICYEEHVIASDPYIPISVKLKKTGHNVIMIRFLPCKEQPMLWSGRTLSTMMSHQISSVTKHYQGDMITDKPVIHSSYHVS